MATDRVMFVSAWERPYSGFVDRDGREVKAGATRWVSWSGLDADSEPVRVKVSAEVFAEFSRCGAGEIVEVATTLVPAGSGVWRLQVDAVRAGLSDEETF